MTERSLPRRYPLEPLAAAHGGVGLAELGRVLKVSGSTWKDMRERGVTEVAAYRYAERLGLHVYEVWPYMVDDHVEDQMVDCAAPDCVKRFLPTRKGHRFHSERCRRRTSDRDWQRQRYHSDEEHRAQKLEVARQYRQDAKRSITIRRRQYRAERRLAS